MKIKTVVEFDDVAIIKDVTQNLPEYGLNLKCVGWKYDKCLFKFEDFEEALENGDPKAYTVTLPMLKKGFKKLVQMIGAGRLKGLNINLGNITDGGEWDAECVDALVQCAIFGDVIYG